MEYQIYPTPTTGLSEPSVLARKIVQNQLRGAWEEDADFFQRLFPVNAHIRRVSSRVQADLWSEARSKWSSIPSRLKSTTSLYTPLRVLLNRILAHFELLEDKKNSRLFIQTHRRRVLPDLDLPTWPDILLAGAGASFIASSAHVRPIAHYGSGISPLQVRLDSDDMTTARDVLATNMQDMFNYQPNRRYAFGLVISQSILTCYLFDHSGVVSSSPLHYHQQPDQFCALIAGMASTEGAHFGLDTSIFIDNAGRRRIRMRDTTKRAVITNSSYLVESTIFYAPRILGRGTACFLAHREAEPHTRYVIKDAWVSTDELEGRESEASLLLYAQRQGVVKGVAQICCSEDIRFKGVSGRLLIDNTHNIRRVSSPDSPSTRQRVHTRILMSTYGKTLHDFSTRKELLLAYHDAVQAHRNLYEIAGILHRDIKPENILIKAGGVEGDRGVLIDFDHSIRTNNASPYSTKRKIGTYMFMSVSVLDGNGPHRYLDDLESFYYVLVYIISSFTGPRSLKGEPPLVVRGWKSEAAASFKGGQFFKPKGDLEVASWFGTPFTNLATKLHCFFGDRMMAAALAEDAGNATPSAEPAKDYDEFLSYIRQAIADLDLEAIKHGHLDDPHSIKAVTGPQPSKRKHPDNDYTSDEKPSRRPGVVHTMAASRPKRSLPIVNYSLVIRKQS